MAAGYYLFFAAGTKIDISSYESTQVIKDNRVSVEWEDHPNKDCYYTYNDMLTEVSMWKHTKLMFQGQKFTLFKEIVNTKPVIDWDIGTL
jgi:hypothetical protein